RPINQPFVGTSSQRPIPGFSNITQNERANLSAYHSFQAKLERRFSAGITAISSYTWSHSIDCCSGIRDPYNLRWERSTSSFDVRHRQVNSFSSDLPFGPNRHFLSSATGPFATIVSGWQIAGIATFSTGNPLTPTVSGDVSLIGAGSARANRIADGNLPRG